MLSEILFAAVGTEREEKPDRIPGISCSALFPCPYRLYKVHIGETWREELTPRDILNMEDGWDQEEQTVRRLWEKAKIEILSRTPEKRRVRIGESKIPGSCDGTVFLNGKEYLWEHKAMNENSFWAFLKWGLQARPDVKAQVNGYMLGKKLDEAIIMAKYKDGNDYSDIVEPLDKKFIIPIIEWADKIRIEGWVPEPKLCEYCAHCGLRCFGEVLDFSWIIEAKAPEMAEKWRQGDKLVKVGDMLKDEARTYFVGKKDKDGDMLAEGIIGDKDVLLCEGLKIQRIIQHRWDISRKSIIDEFGTDGFFKVARQNDITTYRIGEE